MKVEFELQLQAYLDGELPEREARQMAERLTTDREAQALMEELSATKHWLAGNEPEVMLPESREFYWSKIERAIDAAESVPVQEIHHPLWVNWLKFLVPATGMALAVWLGLILFKPAKPLTTVMDDPAVYQSETENLSPYTTSFAFRSQRENMFVVWISNNDPQPAPEVEPHPTSVHEAIYQ